MAKETKQITHAFWESRDSGLIFLSSDWCSATALPPLLLGPVEQPFSELERLSPEECGSFFRYYHCNNTCVFAVRSHRHPQLLDRKVRVFLGSDISNWEKAVGQSKWELKPISDDPETTYELHVPLKYMPDGKQFAFKFVTDKGEWLDVPDSAPNLIDREGALNFQFNPEQTGTEIFRFHTRHG